MSFTLRLLDKMAPWSTPDLQRYLKAAGKPYEQVEEITEEEGVVGHPGWVPPYGNVMNPARTPYKLLSWLGQFVGVPVKKTATEGEARAEVKAVSGFKRGTRGSLETLLKKALGESPFYILEREPTPYHFVIVVPAGHLTPAVYAEIELTKPAGLQYEVVERSGTWFTVPHGKKWSEVTVGLKWSENKEGEP